jgi:hypothetical protein
MSTAIVYYSLEGNSALVAEMLEKRLDADVIGIECVKPYPSTGARKFIKGGKDAVTGATPALEPYSFDATDYDLIVLVMPVWADHIPPAMNTFLRDNDLSGKRVGLALCSSSGNARKCALDCRRKLRTPMECPLVSLSDPALGKDPDLDIKLDRFCGQVTAG